MQHTYVLRINCNHLKPTDALQYLAVRADINRCLILTFITIDRIVMPLPQLVFEDEGLQSLWVHNKNARLTHEQLVQFLHVANYRYMFEELHERIEPFITHHYHSPRAPATVLGVWMDATYHLCLQLRKF